MNNKQNWFFIILLLFAILIAVIIIPFCIYRNIFNGDFSCESTEWSSFGSFYGGVVSPILAFFSTILLLITILLQKRSTDIQETENAKNLESLQHEINNNNLQIETLMQQRFETTLNNMISHKFSIVDSFAMGGKTGEQIISALILELINNDNSELGDSGFHIITSESKTENGREIFSNLIGIFNYIVSIGIYISNNSPLEKDHYYLQLKYSLTDGELKMLVFAKEKKGLSEDYYKAINKILGDYKTITVSDIENGEIQNIHLIASKKKIINLI